MTKSKVAIVECKNYDDEVVYQAVKRGIELIGGIENFVKKTEKILLKPNILTGAAPDEAVTTHPAVFGGIARLLVEAGYNVSYGDSPGFGSVSGSLTKCGLTSVAQKYNLKLADFEKGKSVDFPEGLFWKKYDFANACFENDAIISLPKMKTHALARITGAVKNQFGCVYGLNKASFHIKIPNATNFAKMLVDINNFIKPRLFIMDGIVAMEGNGPRGGDPVKMNCLIISNDSVAVDSTFCRMVDMNPEFVDTNIYGKKTGLGTYHLEEIEYFGDSIEKFYNKSFRVVRKPADNEMILSMFAPLKNSLIPRPVINASKCLKCGVCVESCPVDGKALNFKDGKKVKPPVYDYKKCIRCYCCQEMCPYKAIGVVKPFLGRLFTGK